MFDLLVRLVEYTKDETEFSIDDAIDHLSSDHNIIHVDEDKQEQRNQARHLIFAALGWTSGLYRATAPNQSSQEELRIRSNALATSVSSLPLESCERPFSELLELLTGPFLLGRLSDTYDSSTDNDDAAQRTKLEDALAAEEFVVEHVNAATLHRLGGLKIVWVDDMISHLSFDRLSKELQLYRTPSLCKVQLGPNSLVAKLSEGVYSGANRAGSITHKKLFDEILLSYRLIFAEDRHSRKVYHKREQRMSYRWGTNDSTLNELCESVRADQESSADAKTPLASLFSRERWLTRATPTTFSFNKRRMFPILRPRLEQIQEYMLRRQPNQMWTLWIDRRDKPKWLTFWGVLIFGTLGVTMSFIQMLFAGLQVQIGYKSLECGCKS
ncbi:uncharacterized protein J4E78_007176 [Alternaria triticimaculans]|uniref:uncharacterized protein n=1 Tax=Alternaria triticimaculans TaxID=297637 RepID=UPI0020C43B03|nr:uncharacterized protein J4E78_007176 [Alternaria triticimaculans]KAI4654996.1 hypothetical protein J4E78_007176 [Alternaria triticimaculans]